MTRRALALALVVSAVSSRAAPPDDAPLRAPGIPWQHPLIAALEGMTFQFGLMAFNNLVTRMPFGLVSGDRVLRNLQPRSWSFDADYYLTNQFGHPYQGALYFNAARSAGLSFWWSALSTALGSLTWELFFEDEAPAVNDQITTTIGGSLLGESLHRTALQLRRSEQPRWLAILGATLLDPMGAINDALLPPPEVEDGTLDPLLMRWQVGATMGAVVDRTNGRAADRMPPQAVVAVQLVSGPPWDDRSSYDTPLSYFDLRADLSFPTRVVGDLFVRGSLAATRFHDHLSHVDGVWGLFGVYDYAAPAILRASAVGLGPGFVMQSRPGANVHIQLGGLLGLSPFTAAGQLAVSPDVARDYHVGPGLQLSFDLRFIRPGWFLIEFTARSWLVVGAYVAPAGFEFINSGTLGVTVPVWRWLSVGGEANLADRRARFDGDGAVHDTGLVLRLLISAVTP